MKLTSGSGCRIILLLISVYINSQALAQQDKDIPLQPGDKAPALTVFKWIKGKPVTNWKKGHIYIVEFGATWCTPCAKAIPKLQAIQKRYKDSVTVISLFVQEQNLEPMSTRNPAYVKYVEQYIQKRDAIINYTVGVDGPQQPLNNAWLRKSPQGGVPQMFVIDKNGVISWWGDTPEEAASVVEQVMRNNYIVSKFIEPARQTEIVNNKYDRRKLLLVEGNAGKETDFLFRSLLTRYNEKADSHFPAYIFDITQYNDPSYSYEEDRFEALGVSLGELYYYAYGDTLYNVPYSRIPSGEWLDTLKYPFQKKSYGKYWHEPVIEVTDKTPFETIRNSAANRFSYSLKVPKGAGKAGYIQRIVRNDLNSYFGYHVSVEDRLMPYWKLSAPDRALAISKLTSKDPSKKYHSEREEELVYRITNGEMRDVIYMLGSIYGFKSFDYGRLPHDQQAAFVDESGIIVPIDFTMNFSLSFDEMKAYLQTVGLQLSKSARLIKVVVIRDPQTKQ